MGTISNFNENSRRYSQLYVNRPFQRHRGEIIAGVVDTGDHDTAIKLSPVTSTPAIINLDGGGGGGREPLRLSQYS